MTETFKRFEEQFNSLGRKKMDGYDASHFDGLSDKEKIIVFSKLKEEFCAPGVLQWMICLDKSLTINFLKKKIEENEFFSGIHRVLFALLNETNNQKYLNKIFECYPNLDSTEKVEVVWMTYHSKVSTADKMQMYKSLLLSDEDKKPSVIAADFYLLGKGIERSSVEDKDYFYRLRDKLSSGDIQSRKAIIPLIERVSS